MLSGIETGGYEAFSLRMFLEHLNGADEAQEFFKTLQLGFTRFTVKKTDIPKEAWESAPDAIKSQLEKDLVTGSFVEPITTHNVYDEKGTVVGERNFHKNQMESEGTKKVIEMSGPIFDTLNEGKTLIVDELDAKLHPLLTRNIVLLFMDPERKPLRSQLTYLKPRDCSWSTTWPRTSSKNSASPFVKRSLSSVIGKTRTSPLSACVPAICPTLKYCFAS